MSSTVDPTGSLTHGLSGIISWTFFSNDLPFNIKSPPDVILILPPTTNLESDVCDGSWILINTFPLLNLISVLNIVSHWENTTSTPPIL